ncbi:uncharacterized protein LOC131803509 [Musca domestica]|uniref:Uncharacterized protein LOC131801539 n=1 Tax=Musca domestica TaxID=7370 RepID=A0ABM3V4Y5_MUSDO|nr:uncharacterized protein LOC131801539 [Musca domestica]XP_058980841.1 uncharacterized protein LOC131803509 [Musca domestica]XP_058980842.1 uncharacterized protein LOC131803509 [Musca domestica]
MSVKIYSEEELLNVDDGFDYNEPRPTDPQAGMSSAAVEAALVEPIAAVKISERGSESDKADSSAALAEPMQTESESIATDSSAAPVLDSPPKNDTLQTESGSSGPSAAPVATPHLEESENNLRSETHKVSSAASHKCRLCDRMHPLDRCSDFRVMNVDMRRRIVLKYNDCIRCLSKSHQARDCRSKRKCAVCNEEHHTLLHEDSKTVVKPTNNRQRRPRTDRYRSRNSPYSRPSPPSQIGLVGLLSLQTGICLSPTLIVKIMSSDRPTIVRAVLDPCSRQSQICSSLVHNLRLPTSRIEGSQICRLTVSSIYDRSQSISIVAVVTNLDHALTPTAVIPERIRDSFLGLPLADPDFNRPGRVALVLGPEVYARVVTHRVQATPGLPIAHYTIFGWVLSGICNT